MQCVKRHAQWAIHACRCRFNLRGNYGMTFPILWYQTMDCTTAAAEADSSVAVNTTASTSTTTGKWTYDASTQQYHYNLQVQCTAQQLAGLHA